MLLHFKTIPLFIFTIGLLALPIVFGSTSGAAALSISLIWLPTIFKNESLPLAFKTWAVVALAFFILFAIIDLRWEAFKFGFNTFSFILGIGVYIRFTQISNINTRNMIYMLSFAGLAIGLGWAIYQYEFSNVRRITAFVGGGANLVARIGILLAAFSMILSITSTKTWIKLSTYAFTTCAATIIVIYSGSRGALLALPILLILPVLFALPQKWLSYTKYWIAVLVFSVLLVGLISWLNPNGMITELQDRLLSVIAGEGMDRSTELRYQMWQVAFQSFLEHPIIGTGWHSFVEVTNGTILENYAARGHYFNFHSDIANFAVAGGIVGLILYFLLLFAPLLFWDTPKDHPYFRIRLYWAVTMPILYLVLGLTDMVMGFDYPTMFYAFSFAIIWGLTEQTKGSDTEDLAQAPAEETDRSR